MAAREVPFARRTWGFSGGPHSWACSSPYGEVAYAIVVDDDNVPLYDRPVYREAPHVVTVPFYEEAGQTFVGLVLEARAHGGGDFWGVPRGFLKSGETPEQAALREAGQEAGVEVVLSAVLGGFINPNPTFVATKGPVVFLKVDRERLGQVRPGRGERIYRAKFFTTAQLYDMIVAGEYEGGQMSDGVSLAAIMMFLAYHRRGKL